MLAPEKPPSFVLTQLDDTVSVETISVETTLSDVSPSYRR